MEADSWNRPVGALVAGGSSRRMGRDKALAELGGRPMFRWSADALEWTDTAVQAGGEPLPGLGWPMVDDPRLDAGPAAAIEGLLERFPGRPIALCAVDLPFAGEALLRACWRLARSEPGVAVALPRHRGRWQPLAAVWTPLAHARLTAWLNAGRRQLHALLQRLPVATLEDEALRACGDPDRLLINVNEPDDLERARRLADADRAR